MRTRGSIFSSSPRGKGQDGKYFQSDRENDNSSLIDKMSLGLILFIVFVLVVNVTVGYVIAAFLGFGPQRGWIPGGLHRIAHWGTRFHGMIVLPVLWMKVIVRTLVSFFSQTIPFIRRIIHRTQRPSRLSVDESMEDRLKKITSRDVKEYLEDESAMITQITPIPELFDDNLMQIIFDQGTEIWLAQDKGVETSIYKLNLSVSESDRHAGISDEAQVSPQKIASIEEVKSESQNLADECRDFLENQLARSDNPGDGDEPSKMSSPPSETTLGNRNT